MQPRGSFDTEALGVSFDAPALMGSFDAVGPEESFDVVYPPGDHFRRISEKSTGIAISTYLNYLKHSFGLHVRSSNGLGLMQAMKEP